MSFSGNIPLTLIIYFSGIFIFSVLINGILLRLARTLGIRNNPEMQIRWSPTVKPAVGGISFYVIFLFSFIFIGLALGSFNSYLLDKKLLGFLCAVTLGFLMGLADDAYDTKPLLKFSTQIFCAILLMATGTKINCFTSEFLNYALTVVWIVGIMNSINMLDNMDGITTLVNIVILGFVVTEQLLHHNGLTPEAMLCLAVAAALCGFLVFNWHPSKMFMGDTGSQFLGVFTGAMAIDFCWNAGVADQLPLSSDIGWRNLVVVALVFILPLADTTTVFINRMARGVSPFVGGKDHTTHHLFFKGITEKRIAVLFVFLGTLCAFFAHYVTTLSPFEYTKYGLVALLPALIFLALFLNTRIKKK